MKNIETRTFACIDLAAARHNYNAVKNCVADKVKIMPVIKADAYGHGASRLARLYAEMGAHTLCVACIAEALELRRSGITLPILILGPTHPQYADTLCDNDITQTVHSLCYAEALCDSLTQKKRLKVHVKLDTGMRRIGFTSDDAPERLLGMKKLEVCGIFTHFAESDTLTSDFTDSQLEKYTALLKRFEGQPLLRHTANSAACMCHSDTHFDAVRPGIILYGSYPSHQVKEQYEKAHEPLLPVMSFRSRITHIFDVKKGESIGYSRTFYAPRDMKIATVCAGYGDGVPRLLSNRGRIGVGGRMYNIVGNVCMDQLMIDVSDGDVSLYDEAVIFGAGGDSCDVAADICSTISYELYCGITSRVPRIYIGE